MTIGKRLLKWREIQNISQDELSRRTGITREYISKIENDHIKNLTWNTIKRLASAFYVQEPSTKDTKGIPMMPICFLAGVD